MNSKTTTLAMPCEFCRRHRELTPMVWCGEEGCELTEEVWPCSCDGGRWKLRAELLEDDGHTPECAAATARAWMEGRTTVNCALDCGQGRAS